VKHLSPSPFPLPFAEDSVQNLLSSEANPSCSRAGEGEFLPQWSLPGDLGQARDSRAEPGPRAAWLQQSYGTREAHPYSYRAARESPAACLAHLLLCPSTSGAPAEISGSDVPVGVLTGGRVLLRTQLSLSPSRDPPFPF